MGGRGEAPNWYVITGVPSSGITTLANALRPYVHKVFPEAARILIDKNLKNGIPVSETRGDEGLFQQRVLHMKLQREANAKRNRTYIFERGVPDSIPYFKVSGLDPAPLYAYSANRYKKVFFLEPLPYVRDYARTETEETRERLNVMLIGTYKYLGYNVITIPAVSVKERVKLVLKHLERQHNAAPMITSRLASASK